MPKQDVARVDFDPANWGCVDTYSDRFAPLPDAPGIYAIYGVNLLNYATEFRKELIYIGISCRIKRRLNRHPVCLKARAEFDFVCRSFVECPFDKAQEIEPLLIRKHKPRYNTQHN